VHADHHTNPVLEVQAARQVLVPRGASLLVEPEKVQWKRQDRDARAIGGEAVRLEMTEGADSFQRGVIELLHIPNSGRHDPDAPLAGLAPPDHLAPDRRPLAARFDGRDHAGAAICAAETFSDRLDAAVEQDRTLTDLAPIEACFELIESGARRSVIELS